MTQTGNRIRGVFVAVALIAALIACGFSASTARITNAFLAADPDGAQPTESFQPDETFYLLVDLANAPDDTQVKAAWTAADVEGEAPDTLIDEAELTTGDGRLTFNLTNDGPWPAGAYKVDIYLNEKLERTLEFAVEG
jgi:hypothetical protein